MSIGFTLPFQESTGSIGHFQMTDDELSAVENDLRSLLTTNWGERLIHFNFGCNLREYLFEPLVGEDLKVRIADRILSQVGLWMPFVIVDQLNVLFTEDFAEVPENGIGVAMGFKLASKPDIIRKSVFIITP